MRIKSAVFNVVVFCFGLCVFVLCCVGLCVCLLHCVCMGRVRIAFVVYCAFLLNYGFSVVGVGVVVVVCTVFCNVCLMLCVVCWVCV